MRTRYISGALLLLGACRTQTGTATPTPTPTPSGGEQTQTEETARVRSLARPNTPTCEAQEPRSLTALTVGFAGQPAIARNGSNGLIAYRADADRNGTADLLLLALDGDGRASGNPRTVRTGPRPMFPALIAFRTGYLLAWREGLPGHEQIQVRELDLAGTDAAAADRSFHSAEGWMGAPALLARGENYVVAWTSNAQSPGELEGRLVTQLQWQSVPGGTLSTATVESSAPWRLRGHLAPVLTTGGQGDPIALVSAWNTTNQRPLVLSSTLASGATLTGLLQDADAPTAIALENSRLIAWRAQSADEVVATRSLLVQENNEQPPQTMALYRGAFSSEVGLFRAGTGVLGAFTLSTLADDAGGTLNVSLLDLQGRYLGRQPLLMSSLLRSPRVVGASAADGANVWLALEARADDGAVALGLVSVQCDAARATDALRVPAPTLVQRLSEPDQAPLRISAPSGPTCTVDGEPRDVSRHFSGAADALVGSQGAVVPLTNGSVLLVVRKPEAAQPSELVAAAIGHEGAPGEVRVAAPGAVGILASGARGNEAIVVAQMPEEHTAIVLVAADGRARPVISLPIVHPSSAVVVPGGGGVLLVGETPALAGDTSLWWIPLQGTRAGTPMQWATLRPGDVVLDAQRGRAETMVLLGRPDSLGGGFARALSTITVQDRTMARAASLSEPFSDPLGYGRGPALLVGASGSERVLWSEQNVLRGALLRRGELRELRSEVELLDGGGRMLSRTRGPNGVQWLGLHSGFAENGERRPGLTAVSVDARGAVTSASAVFPAEAEGIARAAVVGGDASRIVVLYPRAVRDGELLWRVARGRCNAPAAAPAANAGATASSQGGAR